MVQGFRFVCDKCDHNIVAWDDGNPYYIESVLTPIQFFKQLLLWRSHPICKSLHLDKKPICRIRFINKQIWALRSGICWILLEQ